MVIAVHDREDTKLSKDTNNRAGVTITEIPDGFLQTPQNSRTFWRFGGDTKFYHDDIYNDDCRRHITLLHH